MLFGTTIGSFNFVHTVITLVAIVTGLIVQFGLLRNERMNGMTAIFLLFSVLTAITGFMIQAVPVTPAVITGIILSAALIPALAARYLFGLHGAWRWIYVVTATISLYLNCFVLVVQSFVKFPALHALAPGRATRRTRIRRDAGRGTYSLRHRGIFGGPAVSSMR
jgi:hypothetical protein